MGAQTIDGDRLDISRLLAHQPPALLIDSIERYQVGELLAVRYLDPDHPCFRGHFPTEPVLPGTAMLEMMAQAAGALIRLDAGGAVSTAPPTPGRLVGIEACRFRAPASPHQTLFILAHRPRRIGQFYRASGVITCQDAQIAEAELILSVDPGGRAVPSPHEGEMGRT